MTVGTRLMFCQGWRTAPLCWLDIATRCKVPAICRAHDRSAEKAAQRTWIDLDDLAIELGIDLDDDDE